jgi:hypothetical protein
MADLTCNNSQECGSVFLALNTEAETDAAARVHGWRVWTYGTMNLVLCPKCVGQRTRRDPVPERLEGEQPLF